MINPDDLPPPLPLILAYAPRADREWYRLCWALDARMGRIVLGAREPAVAAVRLAWWDEALSGPSVAAQGQGEPLVAAWRAGAGADDAARLAAGSIAGAWRMLLDPAPMTLEEWISFGQGRGSLFGLLTGREQDKLCGAFWALWDVARFDPDRARAQGAWAAARTLPQVRADLPKPLRLLVALAHDDRRTGRMPEPDLRIGQYLRLVRRGALGS